MKASAFTLIELLVVICIMAILVAITLPIRSGPDRSPGVHCMSNQKQIALGVMMWNQDYSNQFPWEISSANSGTKEFAEAGYTAPNFQILSNYLKETRVFVCPTDKLKIVATNAASFKNQNISYFLGIDAGTNAAASILTGDRNLEMNGKPVKPGLIIYYHGVKMNWTRELHGTGKFPFGAMSFYDGHCEVIRGTNLDVAFQRQGTASNRFDVP